MVEGVEHGVSGNSDNNGLWCGEWCGVVSDIIECNIDNYIRLCWVWCEVVLWIRTNFTRFTLIKLCFVYI